MRALLFAVLCFSVGVAYAVDEHHPEQGKAPPAAAKPAPKAPAPKVPGAFQEQMKKAQTQADRLKQTSDPKERQMLMQEHMQAMQEGMRMMRGMAGGKGDAPAQKGGGMMMGGDMHQSMHGDQMNRMDMMQQMMEQMMQHMSAMQPKP